MRLVRLLAGSALFASTIVSAQTATVPDSFSSVPLIERSALFGNPERASARLSPDGQWLSWTAPVDGVMNLHVAPAASPDQVRVMTSEKVRPVRQYFWSPDSRKLLFIQDKGGDENFLLYSVDVATAKQSNLTPFTKTRVVPIGMSHRHKDRMLVGLNNRDAKWHDVYSLNLNSGKLTLVMRNDRYASFVADDNLNIRLATISRNDGGTDFYRVTNKRVDAKPFASTMLEDALTTEARGYSYDGSTLYWIDSRGRNTAALVAQDSVSGATSVVAENSRADIADLLVNPNTGRVDAWLDEYLKPTWVGLNDNMSASMKWLEHQMGGPFFVQSRTDDDARWIVSSDVAEKAASTYLFDRKAGTLTKLYTSRPALAGAPLQPMWPVEVKARDGQTLVSYLTLPAYADPDKDGKADVRSPMVLFVHGGPWARDYYGYNSYHQWFANRGYSVLSVNYRASTGFGKAFVNAGNLQWGKSMHDDLIDAVDWAVANNVTSPDKVAIEGGSYGGYATLAGLTLTPDKFACGVDIVGPSNLFTLLKTIPPYWESFKQQFYQRMGDPTTEAGRAILTAASPLTHVDKIKKPLLIGQGANDPRVNQAESDQIVAAMKAKGIPVTYVLFPDEGHGFARPVNNIAFNAINEAFLEKCLGGRAEPIGNALVGSTAKVPHGAEYAPGLSAALKP